MGSLLRKLKFFFSFNNPNRSFPGSADYWETRYAKGGNSGSGSYNQLALFKAEILNDFVSKNQVQSVIEFGCGDGNQLSLAKYPKYIGMDVSKTAISICAGKFMYDKTKNFFLYDSLAFYDNDNMFKCELALSLDVIYHLIEDRIFINYMAHLFNAASRFVIIYSNDVDEAQVSHEKNRFFTKWIDENRNDWHLVNVIKNRFPENPAEPDETSKSDFFIYAKR